MKLDARWALPVYPVLKAQSWNSRKNSGNNSKEKIAHTYDKTTRTTLMNTEPPQMP